LLRRCKITIEEKIENPIRASTQKKITIKRTKKRKIKTCFLKTLHYTTVGIHMQRKRKEKESCNDNYKKKKKRKIQTCFLKTLHYTTAGLHHQRRSNTGTPRDNTQEEKRIQSGDHLALFFLF
jgi:hypothetical protein